MKRPYQSFSNEKLVKRQGEFLEELKTVANKTDAKFITKNLVQIRDEILYRISLHADWA